jgi:hypothetical protein
VAEEKEVQIAQSELITPKLIKRGWRELSWFDWVLYSKLVWLIDELVIFWLFRIRWI